LNPHRERNHGSIEHRESIKRMLQKRNVANRKRALQGKLQKIAVQFRAFTNSSSFVGNMRYDQDEQSMTGILSGKHYQWCGVPESKFDSFQGAGSAGAFFNRDIKGQYDCSSMGKLNEVKSRLSQLQKFAANYDVNKGAWGSYSADFEAIEAFKNKEEYTSGKNPKISGAKWKYRSDGQTLFLHDTPVARHHKDGIEVSNGEHDTPLGAETHNALGINSRPSKHQENGMAIVGGKEVDKNSGEWVLVKHEDILKEPVRLLTPNNMRKTTNVKPKYPLTKKLTKKRSNQEQHDFSEAAIIQGREEGNVELGLPLSKINIQPDDQKSINDITGINSPIGFKKRGTEAHHILGYSANGGVGRKLDLNKKKGDIRNNSIMIPSDSHEFISNFQKSSPKQNLKRLRQMDSKIKQLKGKLQKIATDINRSPMNNTMEEIGSYDWKTGKKLSIEQMHALGNGSDVFAVAVTKNLNKNSDFRIPEEYINNDFGVEKLGLVKGIYENDEGLIEHDRTYLFHGSDDEVQKQLNSHNDINKGITQESAGRIYKDEEGIIQYQNIPNKQFKQSK